MLVFEAKGSAAILVGVGAPIGSRPAVTETLGNDVLVSSGDDDGIWVGEGLTPG